MANKHEVKGVTAKKQGYVVNQQPYRPERKHMKKEDVLKEKEIERAAKIAAERAAEEVYKKANLKKPDPNVTGPEKKENEMIVSLRKQLANAEAKLIESPTSSAWKNKVRKLSEELEVLEANSTD